MPTSTIFGISRDAYPNYQQNQQCDDLGDSDAVIATIDDYTTAICHNPRDAAAYNNRGVAYAEQQNFAAAIDDYRQALSLEPYCGAAYINGGLAFKRVGNRTGAIASFSMCILMLNQYLDLAHYNRALCDADNRNYAAAIGDFEEVLRITTNPDHQAALQEQIKEWRKMLNASSVPQKRRVFFPLGGHAHRRLL